NNMNTINKIILSTLALLLLTFSVASMNLLYAQAPQVCQDAGGSARADGYPACTSIDTGELGFKIPSLGDILTFVIRAFFVFAGLAALFYMLLGAFAWVTSGGDSDAVSAAQGKIQAAVVGMLIIVGVLAIIWTLEQVIFNRRICLGLSCPLTLPGLIQSDDAPVYCCVCVNKNTGELGAVINVHEQFCTDLGNAGSTENEAF
ncbi:MAG: hypothetical protein KDC90_18600, partial [Ignavibacteriae bacterium]|nr:hypothetical protein [Ignavibacteriota bacterium]